MGTLCAIWYHLYNLKNVKNTHGATILHVPASLLKLIILRGCFSCFLNCTNGTESSISEIGKRLIDEMMMNKESYFSNQDTELCLRASQKD